MASSSACVVSSAVAGLGGALYAHYVRIVDPDVFLFIYTVTMVIMVIAGGKGTLAGPIVGGLIFGFGMVLGVLALRSRSIRLFDKLPHCSAHPAAYAVNGILAFGGLLGFHVNHYIAHCIAPLTVPHFAVAFGQVNVIRTLADFQRHLTIVVRTFFKGCWRTEIIIGKLFTFDKGFDRRCRRAGRHCGA